MSPSITLHFRTGSLIESGAHCLARLDSSWDYLFPLASVGITEPPGPAFYMGMSLYVCTESTLEYLLIHLPTPIFCRFSKG